MYGHHSIPLRIEEVGISISLEKLDDSFVYRRDGAGGQVKKILLEKPERVTISPVEPVNLPKQVAQYVLVEFANPVLVRPGGDKGVFLEFPAEIGVHFFPPAEHYGVPLAPARWGPIWQREKWAFNGTREVILLPPL